MTRKIILLAGALFSFLISSTAIAAVAIPGPQRLLAPGLFGFEEISQNVFVPATIDMSDRQRVVKIVTEAEGRVSSYFGAAVPRPTIVVCPDDTCNAVFGQQNARGVAYGKRAIRLNKKGINTTIASHELTHTALKGHVGEWRTFFGAVPAWFDEGLAVFVSRDDRFTSKVPEHILRAIQSQSHWRDWNELTLQHGWRQVYGGSLMMVAQLDAAIGQEGILQILDEVADGVPFDEALSAATTTAD